MKYVWKKWCQSMVFGIAVFFFSASLLPAEEVSYAKGIGAYEKKDYEAAAKYLGEYVKKKPDAYAYYLLGYACYKLKKHSESVRYFKEAYNLDPSVSAVRSRR